MYQCVPVCAYLCAYLCVFLRVYLCVFVCICARHCETLVISYFLVIGRDYIFLMLDFMCVGIFFLI